MISQEHDLAFLKQALRLAQQRRGFCAPNPAVGAVVVKEGEVIGEGSHWACGHSHAEAVALQSLGKAAEGARLYVTLEPCSHQGRTPPCTDLIIRSGVSEVIFGMSDPNPQVSGRGAEILRQAGIVCQQLVCAEIENFYQSYRYWLAKRLPWATIKLAVSLDGKIAGFQGAPVNITGIECRNLTHQQRRQSDAILTTAATIIADDPQLNVRLNDEVTAKPLYILDSHLRLPVDAQVFHTTKSMTIFHSATAATEKRSQLQDIGVRCILVDTDEKGLDLSAILAIIGEDGCHDLWIEAGGRCFQSFLSQNLAQRIIIYVAPKILGPSATAAFTQPLIWSAPPEQITWQIFGSDAVAQITILPP